MIRTLKKFETNLAEITYMIECGWEVFEEEVDGVWRKLGLAAPARRALVNAKLLKLGDLKKISEKDFLALHGMGPSAAKIIKVEMRKKKLTFKKI